MFVCVAALASSPVFAQSVAGTGTGQAQAGSTGGSLTYAPVSSVGGTQYDVNSALSPGLVAGIKTCFGSVSAGLQLKDFGFSSGKTYQDADCQAGEFGQQLWNQGYKAASIGVLCSRDVIRYAIAVTGGIPYRRSDGVIIHRACPMKEADWEKAGEPLLEPITGQPYTEADLNPPVQQAAAAPTAATMEQAKALLIEQHAKDAQLQANADTSLTQK
jgi:hypothetical protein